VVSWDDDFTFDMKAQLFDPAGTRIGGEFQVNAINTASEGYGDIVALQGGGFVATWRTTDATADGSGYAVKARVFDSSGKGGTEFLVNSARAGDQYSPSVAALSNGGFVIAWHSGDTSQDGSSGAIKAQRFDAAGNKLGLEFLVNTHGADFQSDPQVTALSNGRFVVTWSTADPAQDGSSFA
jgi:hypothetical protein